MIGSGVRNTRCIHEQAYRVIPNTEASTLARSYLISYIYSFIDNDLKENDKFCSFLVPLGFLKLRHASNRGTSITVCIKVPFFNFTANVLRNMYVTIQGELQSIMCD